MTEAAQEQGVNFPAHYGKKNGASDRIRTGDNHVGNVMLYQLSYTRTCLQAKIGASDRIRTGDNHVGNVMLYQLSYTRLFCSNNIAYIFILSSPQTNFF